MFRMTTNMAAALGYDSMGNNEVLLASCDAAILEAGTWKRVSGDVVCSRCSMPYRLHPPVQGALYLIRTCDNGLVKL